MDANLEDEKIQNQMEVPFWGTAYFFKISITTEDIDYLDNVIKSDKCYDLVCSSYNMCSIANQTKKYTESRRRQADINQIAFYDKFYNDPRCPRGMKILLFVYLGVLQDHINYPDSDRKKPTGILDDRRRRAGLWLDKVRETER